MNVSGAIGRNGRAWLAILGAGVALAVLLARDPDMLARPAFLDEEIAGFWAATFVRPALQTLLIPWDGFLYVLPRAAFLASRLVPVSVAPVVVSGLFVASLALLAAFVVSDRLAGAIPSWQVRLVGAIGLVLLPFAGDYIYTTILDVSFWGAIYLTLLLLASPAPSTCWLATDLVGAAIASLSGPMSLLLAPFYALGSRRRPLVSLVVLSGAAVQAATLLGSSRPLPNTGLIEGAVTAAGRVLIVPLGDRAGVIVDIAPVAMVGVAVLVLGAFTMAQRSLPPRTVALLAYTSLVVALAGSVSNPQADLVPPMGASRYFVPAAWTILLVAAAALANRRRSGLLLSGMFIVGVVFSFRVAPTTGSGWACVGGPTPCVEGKVVWTGQPATYRLPVGLARGEWVYPDR